jgi:hypothetical protein
LKLTIVGIFGWDRFLGGFTAVNKPKNPQKCFLHTDLQAFSNSFEGAHGVVRKSMGGILFLCSALANLSVPVLISAKFLFLYKYSESSLMLSRLMLSDAQ